MIDVKKSPITTALLEEGFELAKTKTHRHYYKGLGLSRGSKDDPVDARTRGVEALFTDTVPYIHKNDYIAGSCFSTIPFGVPEEEIKKMEDISAEWGERNFLDNFDHFCPHYEKLLKLGVTGYIDKIHKSKEKYAGDSEKIKTLDSMERTLHAMIKMMSNYADKALSLIGTDGYCEEALRFIADNSRALTERAPETFAEALQLVWYTMTCYFYEGRFAQALGRMDQYLYPFYRRDIDSGIITEEKVVMLLENVFAKIAVRDDTVNIAVAGKNIRGESDENELSFHILHAVRNVNLPGPNLSARISKVTSDEYLDECLKVIGTGLGYPALMNDDVNIDALIKYGYKEEDVYDYCMVGCIENFLAGKQKAWSDGRFDAPRFFEYLFNNGKRILYPNDGIDTGDVSEIDSMDEFMRRFELQLQDGLRKYVEWVNSINSRYSPKTYVSPYLSCFCDDCIDRGLDINDGGAIYPSAHGIATMGLATTADSLAAIEKVVFIDHEATLKDIGDAMRADFEGYDELREKLLAAPKYGNNDDFVDKYAVWYVDFFGKEARKYHMPDGGDYFIDTGSNVANVYAGKIISATPDGRHAKVPLSDNASPTYGQDTRGFTNVVASLSKPDYAKCACGSVVNQKFSPAMFEDGKREKLLQALRIYFERGGQEMQINATSRDVLIDAMAHPENYKSLVVRVSGFSALFIDLAREVQEDILARTQQE